MTLPICLIATPSGDMRDLNITYGDISMDVLLRSEIHRITCVILIYHVSNGLCVAPIGDVQPYRKCSYCIGTLYNSYDHCIMAILLLSEFFYANVTSNRVAHFAL